MTASELIGSLDTGIGLMCLIQLRVMFAELRALRSRVERVEQAAGVAPPPLTVVA